MSVMKYSNSNAVDLYFSMLRQATDGVVIIDDHNKIIFFNTAAENLWGYSADQVIGQNVNCLVPWEHRAQHDGYIERNKQTGVNRIVGTSREVVFTRSNGDYVAAEMSISTAVLEPGRRRYYMAFLKGVTEESHRRKLLDLQSDVFSQLASAATEQDIADMLCAAVEALVPNSIVTLLQVTSGRNLEILSGEGLPRRKISMLMRTTLTDGDIDALTHTPEEAKSIVWKGGQTPMQDAELQDCWASAVCNAHGELIGIFALYSRNRDKMANWPQKIVSGCLPSCAAIIERGKTSERLNRLDRYDTLTGLLNRSSISVILRKMTEERPQAPFALLVLDIDLFQDINNLMGYDQGDILLQNMAQRLQEQCRSNFVIGRLGGDDFVVIIPDANRALASAFAESLAMTIQGPVLVKEHELFLGFSIGISLYPEHGSDVEQLLAHAEAAMREAKKTARGGFLLQSDMESDDIRSRVIIGSALRSAIQNAELELHYQPQISCTTGQICGAEALARWTNPALGSISPAVFIGIAEQTGQIESIDRWSLEKACWQLAEWDRQGVRLPVVSVNISAAHLRSSDLPFYIEGLLKRHAIAAERITIEITEGVMIQQSAEIMNTLNAIRKIGVGLSLDDFGTGFSSLSRLAQLPLTEIKIDRSFVMQLDREVSALIITDAAINIGKRLGVNVVTEGVEEHAQQALLSQMGCDIMQGYLFSKPMSPSDFFEWMKSHLPFWKTTAPGP